MLLNVSARIFTTQFPGAPPCDGVTCQLGPWLLNPNQEFLMSPGDVLLFQFARPLGTIQVRFEEMIQLFGLFLGSQKWMFEGNCWVYQIGSTPEVMMGPEGFLYRIVCCRLEKVGFLLCPDGVVLSAIFKVQGDPRPPEFPEVYKFSSKIQPTLGFLPGMEQPQLPCTTIPKDDAFFWGVIQRMHTFKLLGVAENQRIGQRLAESLKKVVLETAKEKNIDDTQLLKNLMEFPVAKEFVNFMGCKEGYGLEMEWAKGVVLALLNMESQEKILPDRSSFLHLDRLVERIFLILGIFYIESELKNYGIHQESTAAAAAQAILKGVLHASARLRGANKQVLAEAAI